MVEILFLNQNKLHMGSVALKMFEFSLVQYGGRDAKGCHHFFHVLCQCTYVI